MPNIPNTTPLTASSVDILNAIRNSATANYRNYVPAANQSLDSIREIGAVIMQFPALQNEFLTALVNRIGRVLITNKMYTNPWAVFKRGTLEFGETIEDHIMSLANVIASYGLTTVKTDKEYLVFEAPLNALLAQNYNYQNGVKLEEV